MTLGLFTIHQRPCTDLDVWKPKVGVSMYVMIGHTVNLMYACFQYRLSRTIVARVLLCSVCQTFSVDSDVTVCPILGLRP